MGGGIAFRSRRFLRPIKPAQSQILIIGMIIDSKSLIYLGWPICLPYECMTVQDIVGKSCFCESSQSSKQSLEARICLRRPDGLNNTLLFSIKFMNNLTKYFSTAPVVAFIALSLISGLIIEVNRYFPDPLIFAF